MLRAIKKLARSSTFWLGLVSNLAILLQTGHLSVAMLVGAVAAYAAKESLTVLSDRPLPSELAQAQVFAQAATRTLVTLEQAEASTPMSELELERAHEELYATQMRPMLRELREIRRQARLAGEVGPGEMARRDTTGT